MAKTTQTTQRVRRSLGAATAAKTVASKGKANEVIPSPIQAEPEEQVLASVPNAFKLTINAEAEPLHYEPGVYRMPVSHAEHWFAKASGVTVVEED